LYIDDTLSETQAFDGEPRRVSYINEFLKGSTVKNTPNQAVTATTVSNVDLWQKRHYATPETVTGARTTTHRQLAQRLVDYCYFFDASSFAFEKTLVREFVADLLSLSRDVDEFVLQFLREQAKRASSGEGLAQQTDRPLFFERHFFVPMFGELQEARDRLTCLPTGWRATNATIPEFFASKTDFDPSVKAIREVQERTIALFSLAAVFQLERHMRDNGIEYGDDDLGDTNITWTAVVWANNVVIDLFRRLLLIPPPRKNVRRPSDYEVFARPDVIKHTPRYHSSGSGHCIELPNGYKSTTFHGPSDWIQVYPALSQAPPPPPAPEEL
jgi:hypothetical protein